MYSRRACRTLNVGMSGRAPLDGEVPGTLASRALWQQNHPIGSRRFPTLPSTVLLSTGKSSGLLAESAVNRRQPLHGRCIRRQKQYAVLCTVSCILLSCHPPTGSHSFRSAPDGSRPCVIQNPRARNSERARCSKFGIQLFAGLAQQ